MTLATAGRAWTPGSAVGPYEIVSFLAAGGMGEIYVARDPRLGRDVALKVLPVVYGSDPDRLKRFEQEARAAGQLSHPNLLTVHDVGKSGELPYIVTELLEGQTLRQALQEKRLAISETLDYVIQIGRGLAAAHDKGIVHRDLKPSNIFVTTDGHVKIVDFGLAKLAHPEWERGSGEDDTISLVSNPGTVVGSAGYMSPEQVQGTRADHRSDIFSFGAVLYEMLSGRRAFRGDSAVEVMHSILKEQPPELTGVPVHLRTIVKRCLEKRPENRYASARDLVFQLQQISATVNDGSLRVQSAFARLVRPLSGAVVLLAGVFLALAWLSRSEPRTALAHPVSFRAHDWVLISNFENHTGEPIFDGMLEYALEREIGESRYVNVVSRPRIADVLALMKKAPGTRIDPVLGREICLRDGGIRALLTGRIDGTGSNYLLSANLVDPGNGATVASFAEQAAGRDKLADAIRRCSSRVREGLGEATALIRQSEEKLASVTTPSIKALQLYSKGSPMVDAGEYRAAEELLKQAVVEDPEFASAYIALAWAIKSQGGPSRPKQDWLRPAEKAFALSGSASERERYFIRGSYYQMTGQNENAKASYEALLSLYPDDYWALDNLDAVFGQLGQDSTDIVIRRAELMPKSFFDNYLAASTLTEKGREPEAEIYRIRAERSISPEFARDHADFVSKLHFLPVYSLWLRGHGDQALQIVSQRAAAAVDETSINEIFNFYLVLGRLRDAEKWSERFSDPKAREHAAGSIAFYRGDSVATARYLLNMKGPPSAHIATILYGPPLPDVAQRSRLLSEAEQGLNDQMQRRDVTRVFFDVMSGAIALDRGQREKGMMLVRRGLKGFGSGSLMGGMSLAHALQNEGKLGEAAEILERNTGPIANEVLHPRAGGPFAAALWMRTQVELMRIYRRTGRDEAARAIESELRKLLAYADPDFVPLRELNELTASADTLQRAATVSMSH